MNQQPRHWLLILLLLLGAVAALRPAPVAAHAELVISDPPAQAVMSRAPARVQLTFTEELIARDAEVQVVDVRRNRVDKNDAAIIPGTRDGLGISLNDNLPDGVYTVQWKVVSAVDGHLTRGAFPFTVGEPGSLPEGAIDVDVESVTESGGVPGVIARWLMVLSAAVLTGSFLFVPLMLAPALRLLDRMAPEGRGRPRDESAAVTEEAVTQVARAAGERLQWLATLALTGAVAATLLGLLVDTATANDISYRAALGSPLWERLTETDAGRRWLARAVLLGLTGLGLALVEREVKAHGRAALAAPSWWLLLTAAGAGALFIQSLGSHAAALRSAQTLATAVDFVHLLAVAVWLGGLVQFAFALLPALAPLGGPPRTRLLAGLIPRFSVIAGSSVAMIVATGIYQTLRLTVSLDVLPSAGWGQALLWKLALFVPLLALAAFNLVVVRRWLAKLAARTDRPARETAARVRLHFRRVLLAEVALAALVMLAVGVLTGKAPVTTRALATGPSRPVILTIVAEDLKGRLVIAPARLGLNRFDLTVTDTGGRPVPDATAVLLRISTLDAETGVNEAAATALGAGRFTATNSYLSTAGFWDVTALVRRPGVDEVRIPFQFTLGERSGAVNVRENRPAAPLARGREIFQNSCMQCHGAGARGDGPLAAALNPKPLDLTVHVPLHTDTELANWIANGVPRTAMTGFKDQFSEEEIQAIINYLRQVAEQAGQER